MAKTRIYPFPEITGVEERRKPWEVKDAPDGQATTDIPGGVMTVPLGDSRLDAAIRCHEMAHKEWSPSEPSKAMRGGNKFQPQILQCVEDARIHYKLKRCAGDDSIEGLVEYDRAYIVPNYLERDEVDWVRLALIAVATATLDESRERLNNEVLETIRNDRDLSPIAKYDVDFARACMSKVKPPMEASYRRHYYAASKDYDKVPFSVTSKLVRVLAKDFENYREMREKRREILEEEVESKEGSKSEEFESGDDGLGEIRDRMDRYGSDMRRERPWVPLTITHAPLTERATKARARKVRATDTGDSFKNIHRFMTDGKVFEEIRTVPGCTVLVDASGSMSWSAADIDALVTKAPAAQVALYAGKHGTGELVIVTRGGRTVKSLAKVKSKMGGSNECDLPALQWLARQKKPRYWVSDGLVTVQGDSSPSASQIADVILTCKRGRIRRVADSDTLMKAIRFGRYDRRTAFTGYGDREGVAERAIREAEAEALEEEYATEAAPEALASVPHGPDGEAL